MAYKIETVSKISMNFKILRSSRFTQGKNQILICLRGDRRTHSISIDILNSTGKKNS